MSMPRPQTVHLGTQYYRAPFPRQKYWRDDMQLMRDSGLDTVQLWVLWSWVEAECGSFRWDDYDELIRTAEDVGLNVVLSTIAEMQPYWIFREVPGCELVTHTGQKTMSHNRGETHFGATPGGCTDHPGVWERMAAFLDGVATRYAPEKHLVGWDVWNELRWNIAADGRCCYCDKTLAKYHQWLEHRYGSLQGLNQAWERRYSAWDEVWPGRKRAMPYTDHMAFQHFLTQRANEHAKRRYDLVKAIDPERPVTVHGGQPSPDYTGSQLFHTLDRGNDWDFADHLDGIGCSSFPIWTGLDDGDFAVRVEHVKSAARGKRVWLSELQGGRSSNGFEVHRPVGARDQQRWLWNGFACGADTILFWCWRDEIFGKESAGFGIIGKDGKAEERLAELRVTGDALRQHGALLAGYTPDPCTVGVLFSPQSYYYHWAEEETAERPGRALNRWCKALVRQTIPYLMLEEAHLTEALLAPLKLIILPRCNALPEETTALLDAWTRQGGTLLVESESGAFTPNGLYAYSEDRWLADLADLQEVGRRQCEGKTIRCQLDDEAVDLRVNQWLTPFAVPAGATCHAAHADGSLLVKAPADQGQVIALGTYAGDTLWKEEGDDPALERLAAWVCRQATVSPHITVVEQDGPGAIHIRTGTSAGRRLLFVFAEPACTAVTLDFAKGLLSGEPLTELRLGTSAKPIAQAAGHRLHLRIPAIGFAVLTE